jgi:hypothetical protein
MSSVDYGAESFEYATLEEALQGIGRLHLNIKKLDDGVERSFTISEEEDI